MILSPVVSFHACCADCPQDLDAKIKLALTPETKSGGGFITEGSCVFAEGTFMDGIFVVSAFAHPPAEPHNVTKDFLAGVNLFGGTDPREIRLRDSSGMLLEEIEAELSRCVECQGCCTSG